MSMLVGLANSGSDAQSDSSSSGSWTMKVESACSAGICAAADEATTSVARPLSAISDDFMEHSRGLAGRRQADAVSISRYGTGPPVDLRSPEAFVLHSPSAVQG